KAVLKVDGDLGILSANVANFGTTTLNKEILRRLFTTDPSENQVRAFNLRQPTTGEWLLRSQGYLK
ncbi:hypothetical protein MMC17_007902, partial [Xylographa soralifera]|nr:hypothetical protein [Xylographa soralifera]